MSGVVRELQHPLVPATELVTQHRNWTSSRIPQHLPCRILPTGSLTIEKWATTLSKIESLQFQR